MTEAPPLLLALAVRIEDAIPSAVFSGIVGDASHTYGFHCSGQQLRWNRGDYSLESDDNFAGAQAHPTWAAAVDISMSTADMIMVTRRLVASWQNPEDDRLDGWYEFIGTLDGSTTGRWVCYAPEWGGPYEADDTHTWHVHSSCRRSQLDNPRVMDAYFSVWIGQTYQQWKAGAPAADPGAIPAAEETDMYFYVRNVGGVDTWVVTDLIDRSRYPSWPQVQALASAGFTATPANADLWAMVTQDAWLAAPVTVAQVTGAVTAALGALKVAIAPEQIPALAAALGAAGDVPLGPQDEPAIRHALETVLARTKP